jgi:hypothetical protein
MTKKQIIEFNPLMGDTRQERINHIIQYYFDDVSMMILREDELTTKTNLILPCWCPDKEVEK